MRPVLLILGLNTFSSNLNLLFLLNSFCDCATSALCCSSRSPRSLASSCCLFVLSSCAFAILAASTAFSDFQLRIFCLLFVFISLFFCLCWCSRAALALASAAACSQQPWLGLGCSCCGSLSLSLGVARSSPQLLLVFEPYHLPVG